MKFAFISAGPDSEGAVGLAGAAVAALRGRTAPIRAVLHENTTQRLAETAALRVTRGTQGTEQGRCGVVGDDDFAVIIQQARRSWQTR